mgnify:CR=1 FL=1
MLAKAKSAAAFPKMSAIKMGAKPPDKLRSAAVILQAFARMIICRRTYYDKFVSAVLIQSTFRKKSAMNFRIKFMSSLMMVQMCVIRWKRRGGKRMVALRRVKRAVRRFMLNRVLTRNCLSIYNTLVYGTAKDIVDLLARPRSALSYAGHKFLAADDDHVYDSIADNITEFRFRNDNSCCYLHCLAKNTNFKFSDIYKKLQEKDVLIPIHEFFKVDLAGQGITHHAMQADTYSMGAASADASQSGATKTVFDSVWNKLHRPLLTYGKGFKLIFGLPWRCKSENITLRLLPDDPYTLIFEDTSMFQHKTRISLFQVRKLYAPDGTNMIGLQLDGRLADGGGDKPKRERSKVKKGGITYEFMADSPDTQNKWAVALRAAIERAKEHSTASVRVRMGGGAGGGAAVGGATIRSSITEAAEALGVGGASEYLSSHCYQSKIDDSFEQNTAGLLSARMVDILGLWIELWLNCNTGNHPPTGLPPSLLLLSSSFGAVSAYSQQSLTSNPVLLLGAMSCIMDVQNRNFFKSTPHTAIFTGSKLTKPKPKFVVPPTDVEGIEEAWASTHKPLLLKPLTLQVVMSGLFGIPSRTTCVFKLADEGGKLVYQASGAVFTIALKDVRKVYVFSPRDFAIFMRDPKAPEVQFFCPHVVTQADWAVHKMWLESVKVAVQRATDPAFQNPPPPSQAGGTSSSNSSAPVPVSPRRGVARRTSISNTQQNLSAMELEWRSQHKPMLLQGEVFVRLTTFGNKKVDLKLTPDLSTLSYRNVEKNTSGPPTMIPLDRLRQLAGKRNGNAFTLNTQHKQYEFSCDSPELLGKWRRAIRVAIERTDNPAYLSYLNKQQSAPNNSA